MKVFLLLNFVLSAIIVSQVLADGETTVAEQATDSLAETTQPPQATDEKPTQPSTGDAGHNDQVDEKETTQPPVIQPETTQLQAIVVETTQPPTTTVPDQPETTQPVAETTQLPAVQVETTQLPQQQQETTQAAQPPVAQVETTQLPQQQQETTQATQPPVAQVETTQLPQQQQETTQTAQPVAAEITTQPQQHHETTQPPVPPKIHEDTTQATKESVTKAAESTAAIIESVTKEVPATVPVHAEQNTEAFAKLQDVTTAAVVDNSHHVTGMTRKVFRAALPTVHPAVSTEGVTTQPPTTETPIGNLLPIKDTDTLEESEINGTMTLQFDTSKKTVNNQFLVELDVKLRPELAKAINGVLKAKALATTISQQLEATAVTAASAGSGSAKVTQMDVILTISLSPTTATRAKRDAPSPLAAAAADDPYTKDDVWYAGPPRAVGDNLQIAFFGSNKGVILPRDDLKQAIRDMDRGKAFPLTLTAVYDGIPTEPEAGATSMRRGAHIWDTHWGLFLAIIVLVSICLLVVIVALIVLLLIRCRCCSRRSDEKPINKKNGKHEPHSVENPIGDVEIVSDETPGLYSAPPPSSTHKRPFWRLRPNSSHSNGKNAAARAEEENGWIVPLDQISPGELEQSNLEFIKL